MRKMIIHTVGNLSYSVQYESSIQGTLDLVQVQDVVKATANGAAFVDGVRAHDTEPQSGQTDSFG